MIAVILLVCYYAFIQLPMERSFKKGVSYLNENKPTEASKELDKVLRVYPKYEPVYLNVANYALKNGQKEESDKRYRVARRLCLINSEIFSERGLVYAKYRNNLAQGTEFYNEHVFRNYLSSYLYADTQQ